MDKKNLFINIVLLLSFINISQAQEVISPAGGNASNNYGSISYSIGQTFYNSYNVSNNAITEGVQQPYEISVVSGIIEDQSLDLQAIVYPNPAADYLLLKIDGIKIQNMSYQIYNTKGQLLENKVINNNPVKISLKNISSDILILKVLQKKKTLKTFRIVKK